MKSENTLNLSERDKKLLDCLSVIRDTEAAKPFEEMDVDLVNEAVAFILDLQGKNIELSPEEVSQRVSKIPFKDASKVNNNQIKEVKRKINKKRVWFIAACIALLTAILCAVSIAYEKTSFSELVEYFGTVDKIPENAQIDVGNDTISLISGAVVYDSVEELVENEKIDSLLVPNEKSGIKIKNVTFGERKEGKSFSFLFDKPGLTNGIVLDSEISEEEKAICTEVTEINGIDCYFCVLTDAQMIQVYFEYNGDTYHFSYCTSDKQALIDIIENLEEYK